MTYIFKIKGETPAKKNSRIILPNGRPIPSKRYQDWHKDALIQLIGQEKPVDAIDYPVHVFVTFTHGDMRRRDSDNGCSSIMDLLVDAGVLADDNWMIVKGITIANRYERGKPECSVIIQKSDN